jgi:putative spermidine/putrescine transport system ATP-binding protein
MSYIKFENINKTFGNNHVLKNVSLEIEKGHLITLLGPSGCGKSTLLRCLAGLEAVDSGKIYLNGEDITHVPPKNRGIGMVFQQYSLFPNLNVHDNVAFGLKLKKEPKDIIQNKVKNMLAVVGLEGREHHYPSQLSGGQQQRVALARAMVTAPKVLLLDEPLSAIDAKLRKSLQIEIRKIQQDLGITTIFVTHDQDEAMVMSDVIHLMNIGEVEQSGSPTEIYSNPATSFAAEFIGNYNIFTPEDFERAVGEKVNAKTVAIRPEIIRVNMLTDDAGRYQLQGRVVRSISRGSTIRYTVECNGVPINVDIMYEPNSLLTINEEVKLSIRRSNVLLLDR